MSAKQWRMMQAIIHEGNKPKTKRGDSGPSKAIAEKYTSAGKGAPESKGKEHHGGKWDHKKKKEKKDDKDVKKSDLNSKYKSLQSLLEQEELEKNIIRTDGGRGATYEVSHGDALKLVGNGMFRFLREHVKDMKDEDFKDIKLDTYTISIRKHTNDMYSGRVNDGHKMIHNFTHRSLPMITADLMSVFEWYSQDDESDLNSLLSEDLKDDDIHGGIKALSENYKKHNLANIYEEMNNIRQEIRSGVAVDLQQVESRMMKLFDKLEAFTRVMSDKHNSLCANSGKEVEQLEAKLLELQSKIEGLSPSKSTVEAYKNSDVSPDKVYNREYFYLPKPEIIIEPNGRIRITFHKEWNDFDKENFLSDMKAKIIKKK